MDLALTAGGDLEIPIRMATADEAIAQHILIRLRFVRGEWFLDDSIGVPYFEKVLVKNPNLPVISSIMQRAISETPGVASVDDFVLTLDAATRRASVSFSCTTDTGAALDFSKEFVL